jgi:hypothetical protein
MSSTLYDVDRMYAQISLSSKIYKTYIVHIYEYNTICRITTVQVYSAENVLKDTIQVRNSGMSGKSASIACDVMGVRE